MLTIDGDFIYNMNYIHEFEPDTTSIININR